jgi:7,8-dihydropterin-6-yl-methyl-4-(beta-D-ribofuranosyl)aminobenzene 5'-phosphate synthase
MARSTNRRLNAAVLITISLLCAFRVQTTAAQEPGITRDDVSVTILTTNLADGNLTQGEWSFSAWLEVGDRRFLFDTGWSPDNVLRNAEILGIDLSAAEDLILSHHHADHTGGIETLRAELSKRNPAALTRIHVAPGIFTSRPRPDGSEGNPMVARRARLEAAGSTFIVHDRPGEIAPGVWVTGPVPRVHDERNYSVGPAWLFLQEDGSTVPDTVPDSQSLVIVTAEGPIMVSGCGHAGLVNSLEYVQSEISALPPQAAIGGFHLFAASNEVMSWTAERVAELGLRHFIGSHCTGIESVYQIRELAGLDRDTARVGAIGTRFETGSGIIPSRINR